jgi:homoserine kinase
VIVRAPASTANLGPGFDALGMAVDLPFDVWTPDASDARPPEGFLAAEPAHPATIAHRDAGGAEELWWRSPIPPGRGLGFSGAAAVAGAFAACGDVDHAFRVAAAVEGHPDNAAPSSYGGFCVSAGGRTIRLDQPASVELVVWWPASTTSTRRARAALPDSVTFADATFNVGRVALLVAAVAAGDLEAWDAATRDRLHQDVRLELSPASAAVLDACRAAGAAGAWLSGSGPTVAALCRAGEAAVVTDAMRAAEPTPGTCRTLQLCSQGVRHVNPDQIGRI